MNTQPQVAQQAAKAQTFPSNSSNQAKPKRRAPSHAQPKSKRRSTSTTLSKSKATTKMPRKRKASRSQFKSDTAPEMENQSSSGSTMMTIPTNSNSIAHASMSTAQSLFPQCTNSGPSMQMALTHFPTISNSLSSTCIQTISIDANHQPLTVDAIAYVSDVFESVFASQINGQTPILKNVRTVLIKKLLLDHAAKELLPRQIYTFEELHDFTVEILHRTVLLS